MQAVHVTNQSVMYRIMPDARNRLTAGYMTSYFIGGALGSLLSASAYQHAGWYGVAAAGGVMPAQPADLVARQAPRSAGAGDNLIIVQIVT